MEQPIQAWRNIVGKIYLGRSQAINVTFITFIKHLKIIVYILLRNFKSRRKKLIVNWVESNTKTREFIEIYIQNGGY